jgi:hypothetical protein
LSGAAPPHVFRYRGWFVGPDPATRDIYVFSESTIVGDSADGIVIEGYEGATHYLDSPGSNR